MGAARSTLWSDSNLLSAIGMTRGTMVRSQTLRPMVIAFGETVTAPVVAIGVSPLGPIGIGRFVWTTIVGNIGIVSGPVLPTPMMATIAVLVLVLANLAALGTGWSAARTRTAVALRME